MSSNSDNAPLCKYFASDSGEGCKHGAACKFSHDLSAARGVVRAQPAESEVAGNADAGVRDVGRRSTRQCRYYRSGFCKDGSRCKYSHDQEVKTNPQNQDETPEDTPRPRQRKHVVCRYFLSSEGCRLGDRCRYGHEKPEEKKKSPNSPNEASPEDKPQEKEQEDGAVSIKGEQKQENAGDSRRNRKSRHPCRYFNSTTGCRLGDDCRYFHEITNPGEESNNDDANAAAASAEGQSRPKTRRRPKARRGFLESDMAAMTESEQKDHRDSEIDILKKRYPKYAEIPRQKSGTAYQITFVPTDPDWPYDLKVLTLNINFPALYPKKMMEVTVQNHDDLPETVRRCITFSIEDWIAARFEHYEKKGRVERVFRPFIRWLDRDMESIVTDALTHYKKELLAREAGIEIIPARHLQARYKREESENEAEDEGAASGDIEDPDVRESESSDDDYDNYDDDDDTVPEQPSRSYAPLPDDNGTSGCLDYNATPKGTEMRVKDLKLGENVGTLTAMAIKLSARCMRCKENSEVSTPPERLNLVDCGRCSHSQLVKYRTTMMHAHSSVLGHLELEECTPFDLLLMDCEFVASCMRCNKNNKVGGVSPGQQSNTWCRSCHAKLSISMEGVQFVNLQPAVINKATSAYKVVGPKAIRNVRDPAIKLGQPLPENGICRHFKKSFRWLRFPCCGKTYPCDKCHEESEDHEMKFANRMLCGFCAREQAFSPIKPCLGCDSNMTSRPTEHWEGGKGCRDVTRMSKTDDKKYSNSNKTVSRKSQTKAQPAKKTVKLRHT